MVDGTRPEDADWAEGYPSDATLVAAALVVVADRDGRELAPWGIFQVVRDGRVVGGMGFIEGPDEAGAVRVGFSETEAAREHEDVVNALAVLIAHAREHGATRILAEAGTPRAVEVLRAPGCTSCEAERNGVRHFTPRSHVSRVWDRCTGSASPLRPPHRRARGRVARSCASPRRS